MVSKIIAVDIDGILTKGDVIIKWEDLRPKDVISLYWKSKPNKTTIKTINQLYDLGFNIVLYTARDYYFRPVTLRWLKKYGVKYNDLIFNKFYYSFLIDDRAVNNVEGLLNEISKISL